MTQILRKTEKCSNAGGAAPVLTKINNIAAIWSGKVFNVKYVLELVIYNYAHTG